MVSAGTETRNIVQAFVAVLIGVLLVPVISSAAADANVTGTLRIVL